MSEINPPGTLFLGVIDELMDVLNDSNNSHVEVVIASHEVNANGKIKSINGKDSRLR